MCSPKKQENYTTFMSMEIKMRKSIKFNSAEVKQEKEVKSANRKRQRSLAETLRIDRFKVPSFTFIFISSKINVLPLT